MASVPPPEDGRNVAYPRGHATTPIDGSLEDFERLLTAYKKMGIWGTVAILLLLCGIIFALSTLGFTSSTPKIGALWGSILATPFMAINGYIFAGAMGFDKRIGLVLGAIVVWVPFGLLLGTGLAQYLIGDTVKRKYGVKYKVSGWDKRELEAMRHQLSMGASIADAQK